MSLPTLDFDILIENPTDNTEKNTEKSRECPICHVSYKYGNSYWQHVRYVHAKFLSQCVICEKCYKRTTTTKHHILQTHKIAWHLCTNYVRRIRKSDLILQRESDENKSEEMPTFFKKKTLHLIRCFNCFDCPESFSTVNELFQHVKVHRVRNQSDDDEYDEYAE